MEHRFSTRNEVNLSVLIFHKLHGCIKALVKNASRDGMLVEMERSVLPKGSVVELAGPASWGLQSKTGLPKALVIHSKDGKAGLMLDASSTTTDGLPEFRSTLCLKKRGPSKGSATNESLGKGKQAI